MPALAVADALRAEGADVFFLGARGRVESDLVPDAGFEIELLDVRGLDRRNPVRAVGALALAVRAVPAATDLLRHRGADAVLGGGGYVAGPGGIAALRLKLPLVLTEADRHLGLANRLLARRAHRVCLAFPIEGREGERYVVTGRPVPAAILTADRAAARRRFGIDPDDRCLLVFGGSQGARSINLAALDAFIGDTGAPPLRAATSTCSTWRDTATTSWPASASRPPAGPIATPCWPTSRTSATPSPPAISCSLARGARFSSWPRPGARRSWCRTRTRLPITSAPTPAWMADAGAATVIEDSALDAGAVEGAAASLFSDPARLEAMATASASLARADAAERVACEILAACR